MAEKAYQWKIRPTADRASTYVLLARSARERGSSLHVGNQHQIGRLTVTAQNEVLNFLPSRNGWPFPNHLSGTFPVVTLPVIGTITSASAGRQKLRRLRPADGHAASIRT